MKKIVSILGISAVLAGTLLANEINVYYNKGTLKGVEEANIHGLKLEVLKSFNLKKGIYTVAGVSYDHASWHLKHYNLPTAHADTFSIIGKVGYKFNTKLVKLIPFMGLSYNFESLKDNSKKVNGKGFGYMLGMKTVYKKYNLIIDYDYKKPHYKDYNIDIKDKRIEIGIGYNF